MLPDVAPTRLQRWIADHRIGVKIGSYIYVAGAITLGAVGWYEAGWAGLLRGALLLPAGIAWLMSVGHIAASVDNWDTKART